MKVWAVCSGEYEDWGVNAIFTTKELADQAVAAGVGDEIVAYELMDRVPVRLRAHKTRGRLDDRGVALPLEDESWESWDYVVPDEPRVRTARYAGRSDPSPTENFVEVYGRDATVVHDRAEQILAHLSAKPSKTTPSDHP